MSTHGINNLLPGQVQMVWVVRVLSTRHIGEGQETGEENVHPVPDRWHADLGFATLAGA